MDEAPFDLGYERRARRLAPKDLPHNSQGVPPSGEHITSVACIGTASAPVPPLIIYKGKSVLTTWTANDNGTHQLATTSDSGWSNTHIQMVWLRDAFDPATKVAARNGRDRRLIFLDGAEFHIKAAVLEACRDRNITVIVLPAHLSGRFQPLDVDFFNQLKGRYYNLLNKYSVASHGQRALKGNFWLWHQMAWLETATPRQIRSAWAKSGIWPPNQALFDIETPAPVTPPQQLPDPFPTPQSARMISADKRAVRQQRKSAGPVLEKTQKALEAALTENATLQQEIAALHEVNRQIIAAKGPRQKQNYPEGGLFDNKYHRTQAAELEKRKRTEKDAAEAKKMKSREGDNVHAPNSVRPCIPVSLTTVQSLEEIESEDDE